MGSSSTREDERERGGGRKGALPDHVDARLPQRPHARVRVLEPRACRPEVDALAHARLGVLAQQRLHPRVAREPLRVALALGRQAAHRRERRVAPRVVAPVRGDQRGRRRLVVEGVGQTVDAGGEDGKGVVVGGGVGDGFEALWGGLEGLVGRQCFPCSSRHVLWFAGIAKEGEDGGTYVRVCGIDKRSLQGEGGQGEGGAHAAPRFVHQFDVVGTVLDILLDIGLCVGRVLEFGPRRYFCKSLGTIQ